MSEKTAAHLLDAIGWKILDELQNNARVPFAELGRRVGLSTPAVTERVRRLEDEGIIAGYHAEVNPERIGFRILAFVGVNVVGEALPRFVKKALQCPHVLEVHRVTGAESFIIKIAVVDHGQLEQVLDSLMPYVKTTTSMVLSSPLTWKGIAQPQSAEVALASVAYD
jgi:Lrp/AsnC family transcriptional regulator, leucine-responsive regulatory protein